MHLVCFGVCLYMIQSISVQSVCFRVCFGVVLCMCAYSIFRPLFALSVVFTMSAICSIYCAPRQCVWQLTTCGHCTLDYGHSSEIVCHPVANWTSVDSATRGPPWHHGLVYVQRVHMCSVLHPGSACGKSVCMCIWVWHVILYTVQIHRATPMVVHVSSNDLRELPK